MAHPPTDIAVSLMRGGTSKGVFVREEDLPPSGGDRDSFLLALMGSPDPIQIDGLGGARSSTSKVMAVARSNRPGCDLDFTFYQVGIDRPVVDARGNCGNLTAAVAPYAIDEGILKVADGTAAVTMYNTNTGRRVSTAVPVEDGRFAWWGSYELDGVPGTGAPLRTSYLDPCGAVTGALFPTGSPRDVLRPRVGSAIEASIVDVTSLVVIVDADALGVDSTITPAAIGNDSAMLLRLESIRAAAAVAAGLVGTEDEALSGSPALPRVAIVGKPVRHPLASSRVLEQDEMDLVVRSTSMQQAHHTIPLTTAMCVAAAMLLPDTIGARKPPLDGCVRLAHPKGIAEVSVQSSANGTTIASVAVTRTARRLLSGTAGLSR